MTPLLGDKTPPEVKAWTVNKYAPRLAYLDAKLKDREFLLDRFSVADGYLDDGPELDAGDAGDRPLRSIPT